MKKVLSFLTFALMSTVAFAQWQKPAPPASQSLIKDGETIQYLYNVGADMFFVGGNEYKARASVCDTLGAAVKIKLEDTGKYSIYNYVYKDEQFRKMFIENSSSIWVDNNNGANCNLWDFPSVRHDNFYITNNAFDTQQLGTTSGLIEANNTRLYLAIAPERSNVGGVDYDEWYSISEEEYTKYIGAKKTYYVAYDLGKAIEDAEAECEGIDLSAEKAVYNNTESTIEQLQAALANVKAAVLSNKASQATVENPGNFTYLVPSNDFEDGFNGWTSTTGAQNVTLATNRCNDTDYPGTTMTGHFFENWNPSNFTGKIYTQLTGLPAGVYKLQMAAFANGGSDTYVYLNDFKANEDGKLSDESVVKLACGNDIPATFSVFGSIEDGETLEIGLEQTEATANWIGIDNVKLFYYGTSAEAYKLLSDEPAGVEVELTNGDFAEGNVGEVNIATYAKDGEVSQMQPVPGWTLGIANGDARAAGVAAYGSGTTFGDASYGVPAAGPEGTNGYTLGMVAVWTGTVQYVQDVTLPAGKYTMTVPVYNTKGTSAFVKNLIGVMYGETKNFATATSYPVGEWTVETIKFELAEETKVTLSLGYEGANVGSGASQHLFIDCVKLMAASAPAPKAESAFIDTENTFTATDKSQPIEADTKLCESDNIVMSQAWESDYVRKDVCGESDLVNTVSINGVKYDMPAGFQAQENVPSYGFQQGCLRSGAVFKFDVKADGVLYVFGKMSYNKPLYVMEGDVPNRQGKPVAYTFAAGQLQADQGDATVTYTLPGDASNYYTLGDGYDHSSTYLTAAQCVEKYKGGDYMELTHWTTGYALGVIAFPVKEAGEYYVAATGSRLISNGFVFVPGAKTVGTIEFSKSNNNGPGPEPHQHDYATAWSYDATNHWHACNGSGVCDASKSGEAAHSYGQVTTQPSYYTCSVCQYVNTTRQNEYNSAVQAAADQAAATNVVNMINSIGTVVYTTDCKGKIEAARASYTNLTAGQKSLVTNLQTLTDAEAAYAVLDGAHAVIAMIDAIGTVEYTEDCLNSILDANAAYEVLDSIKQKPLVTNYPVLVAAKRTYMLFTSPDPEMSFKKIENPEDFKSLPRPNTDEQSENYAPVVNMTDYIANDLDAANDTIIVATTAEEDENGLWVWMEVKVQDEEAIAENAELKAAVETIVDTHDNTNIELGTVVDVKVFKQIPGKEKVAVEQTEEPMTIKIEVPEELVEDGRKFWINNYHDGVVNEIRPKHYDKVNHVMEFEAHEFSVYAIVYSDGEPYILTENEKDVNIEFVGGNAVFASDFLKDMGAFTVETVNGAWHEHEAETDEKDVEISSYIVGINNFKFSFAGLADGEWDLVLPKGFFVYLNDEYDFEDTNANIETGEPVADVRARGAKAARVAAMNGEKVEQIPAIKFSVTVNNGTVTSINGVEQLAADAVVYDLAGRKLNVRDAKGIVILNGKKVLK